MCTEKPIFSSVDEKLKYNDIKKIVIDITICDSKRSLGRDVILSYTPTFLYYLYSMYNINPVQLS